MNWVLRLHERVKKSVVRFPRKDQIKINDALVEMSVNPYSGDLVKLEAQDNLWRRRVGAYRIKFQIIEAQKAVYIYEVERRTSKTY